MALSPVRLLRLTFWGEVYHIDRDIEEKYGDEFEPLPSNYPMTLNNMSIQFANWLTDRSGFWVKFNQPTRGFIVTVMSESEFIQFKLSWM